MSEIQNLREQVRKLKSRLDQIEGTPSSRLVGELVGGADETPDRRGGFATACRESRAQMINSEKEKAIDILLGNPSLVATPVAEGGFRQMFPAIPNDDMNTIIDKFKNGR